MTDREKAIVMAHTGQTMLPKDKMNVFFCYVIELMGKKDYVPVYHDIYEEIKRRSTADFLAICKEEE